MKCKMEQDRFLGWKQSTAAQWAAIQPYAITIQPVSRRSGLWQANNLCGEGFTECLEFLLKNIAKKYLLILTDMLKVQPVAVIAVADPATARNDSKLAPIIRFDVQYMVIPLLQVLPVRALSVSPWIRHPKSVQAAHVLPGWTKSSGKHTNMFTGWS